MNATMIEVDKRAYSRQTPEQDHPPRRVYIADYQLSTVNLLDNSSRHKHDGNHGQRAKRE